MTPAVRKFSLILHVSSSLAWLGAVAAFLVLSIAGLESRDAEIVRGAYVAMYLIGWGVIVPLSVAALLTGIVQSLGTPWGLFRYTWVVTKLVLTIGATLLLLLHQFIAVSAAARRVVTALPGAMPQVGRWSVQLVSDAGAAILVLGAITLIAYYKPWGLTSYGRRKRSGERGLGDGSASAREAESDPLPTGVKVFLVLSAIAVVVMIVLKHLGGHHVRGN